MSSLAFIALGFSMLNCSKELVLETTATNGIEIVGDTFKVGVRKSIQLRAVMLPDNATAKNVLWESADESVATVRDGWVIGKAPGQVNITVVVKENPQLMTRATVNVLAVTD